MYSFTNSLIQTFFFRSRRVKHAGTLDPAFRSNAILPTLQMPCKNGITAAIGARLPVSLPRSNFAKSWTIPFMLILCMLSNATWVKAHSPDVSSTMLVQQKDGTWILQVRSALIAFEQETNNRYGLDAYNTPEEFMDLVIEHLQENLSITFNEKENATLTKGYVKLGHETNVLFTVLNVPENFSSVSVKNSSFKNIYNSQSALMIFKEGFSKQQFALNGKNNYTATLEVNKSFFKLKK